MAVPWGAVSLRLPNPPDSCAFRHLDVTGNDPRLETLPLQKRAPNEKVEGYRRRTHEKQGHALRDRLAEWADAVRESVAEAWPEMPDGVSDRPADVWEPLLAVADAAGGHWPERARAACLELVHATRGGEEASLGIRLLTDLRDKVFCGADRMPTAVILECLLNMDDAPWGDLDDKPINSRTLAAKLLGQYVTSANKPIKPRGIRTTSGTFPKGYYAEDLHDAWERYSPPPPESPPHPPHRRSTAVRAWRIRLPTSATRSRKPTRPHGEGDLRGADRAGAHLSALSDRLVVRAALSALSKKLDGTTAAAGTTSRKRAIFYNSLEFAVDAELISDNPLDRIKWTAPEQVVEEVDPECVPNPAPGARLLAAVTRPESAWSPSRGLLRLHVLRGCTTG